MDKTVAVIFREESDCSMWSYDLLIDGKSMMSFSSDPCYAPEDCTRYRDFEDLNNMKDILKKVVELTKQGYELEYKTE